MEMCFPVFDPDHIECNANDGKDDYISRKLTLYSNSFFVFWLSSERYKTIINYIIIINIIVIFFESDECNQIDEKRLALKTTKKKNNTMA